MWLPLLALVIWPWLSGPPTPMRLGLLLGLAHLGVMGLAAWGALVFAQTRIEPEAARPEAPATVIAPPPPAPGSDQSALLRRRLQEQGFVMADRNRDGQLSRDEADALPGLAERFDRVDADRSGSVSLQELQAAGGR